MEPVLEGLCHYESLKDGTLDLEDIARMKDWLAVKADNEAILRRILEKPNG